MTPERDRKRGIIGFSHTRYCDSHDNARPDAPSQRLAQVEPGHCGRLVCPPLHPQFHERPRVGSGRQFGRRGRRRTRDHRRPIPPRLSAADAGLPPVLRGQRRRPAVEAARDRPAHRPADDPGRSVAGRGQTPRDHGERRRDPRADPLAARVPGQRAVHRRPAVPPAAADAEPADAPRRLRRPGPPQHRRREAPGGRHRVGHGRRRRRRERVQEAQREGEARRRELPRRQVPRRADGDRRRDREVLQRSQGHLPHRREAQDPLRDDRSGGAAREGDRHGPADRTLVQRQRPAVLDARGSARQPHPDQDHRQGRGRRHGEEEGRGAAGTSEEGGRLRRAGQEELAGREQRRQGRRSRLLLEGQDGAGVRQSRLRAEAGADQRPREVTVRLSHHQGDRPARRDHQDAPRGAHADRGSAQVRAGAGRRAEARRPGGGRAEEARRLREGGARARPAERRVGPLPPRRADRRHRHLADGRAARVLHEGRGRQRRAPDAHGLRAHHRHRPPGRLHPETRRGEARVRAPTC